MEVEPSLIHRLFYPQVPAVLCAGSGARFSGMPVVSYASVSSLPPLIAVACKPSSFTLELALASKAFSLCLLDRTRLRAMQRLASVSGRTTLDKLADAGLVRARGARLGVPVVKGAVATIECQLHSRRRLGDHVLLVGLVKACHASKEFAGFWDFRSYRPILYAGWRGGMTTYEGA